MKRSYKEKCLQLDMNVGTASNRLKKNLMFRLVCDLKRNECFRCGQTIENADDLSIDHIKDWFNADKPVELFFDLDNIAFSHRWCNTLASLDKRTQYRNTTKFKGKYQARYWNGKKQVFVGYYATAEEAKEAAIAAKSLT